MLITRNPASHERRQNTQPKAMNQTGTSAVIATLPKVQAPVMYWRSTAKNAAARGSVAAGGGNQNMLERTATMVRATPHGLFLYAK